jgi:hypothetical protein
MIEGTVVQLSNNADNLSIKVRLPENCDTKFVWIDSVRVSGICRIGSAVLAGGYYKRGPTAPTLNVFQPAICGNEADENDAVTGLSCRFVDGNELEIKNLDAAELQNGSAIDVSSGERRLQYRLPYPLKMYETHRFKFAAFEDQTTPCTAVWNQRPRKPEDPETGTITITEPEKHSETPKRRPLPLGNGPHRIR